MITTVQFYFLITNFKDYNKVISRLQYCCTVDIPSLQALQATTGNYRQLQALL